MTHNLPEPDPDLLEEGFDAELPIGDDTLLEKSVEGDSDTISHLREDALHQSDNPEVDEEVTIDDIVEHKSESE